MTSVGVMIFALIGMLPLVWGEELLSYGALPISSDPAERHSLGILLVELGVTIGVAGGMIAIFYGLTERVGRDG
jgi:multicomponent Na+:H+ antiporter subunit B